ncbi:hypothetical protein HELRODRAFT_181924 [Helobdella robusta]|uniref:EGF-like domain-containing protein n=1 Tax=Helobdella robusta TaxID=6412 RepID=T1FHG6_HELRO|nr:hypothetical protein HELRODRAFT_181924 [Helobdella robusta]ESN91996.1 hypothetical protein HELRODRAFT_181924 [Helobdella robusta]
MLNSYFYANNISKHTNNKTKRSYYKHFRNHNDNDDINNNDNSNNNKKHKRKKIHINPCEKAICLNGGSCVWTVGEDYVYQCYCASGYYGANCEYSAAECMTHPCQHEGRCVRSKSVFGFKCICTDGYYGSRCQKKRRKSVYNQMEEEEEARQLDRRRRKLENSGKYSATLAYVNVEFIAILIAMFILFILFLVILERDR